MAKNKKILIRLKCKECSEINYTTTHGNVAGGAKLALQKFCKKCKKHTEHAEIKIK